MVVSIVIAYVLGRKVGGGGSEFFPWDCLFLYFQHVAWTKQIIDATIRLERETEDMSMLEITYQSILGGWVYVMSYLCFTKMILSG